jgi:hypothetical protein
MKNFQNLSEFSKHLGVAVKRQLFYEEAILTAMADLIKDDAKRKFGVYQEQAGPFNEWQQLSPFTMADRVKKGFEPDNPLYRTGDLMHSVYKRVNIAEKKAVIGSDSDIMVWQERGTFKNGKRHIPPRPVLGPAAFENKRKLQKIAAQGVVAWIMGAALKKTGL